MVEVVHELLAGIDVAGRPAVVAVDGRSAGGKSTLADHLVALVPGAAAVHTDDVAWWESFFGWDHLLASGVLEPVRRGEAVAYRPPAWDSRGREGAIEVPARSPLVVVEGVGSSRRSLVPLLDAAVWVQSDVVEARRRGLERDAAKGEDPAFWDEWDAAEVPFLADDRPWERAHLVVCGTPQLTAVPHDPALDVLVALP
jgi:hypothetical protein